MKHLLVILLFFSGLRASAQTPVDHSIWTDLLKKHVTNDGYVNYAGFKSDSARLEAYLHELSSKPPLADASANDKLAFWINAYNAFTVKLIIDHYPLKSIRSLGNPWSRRFIEIGGEHMTLDHIENGIIRKEFEEPRIHFALVCASMSCPKLKNQAYVPEQLEQQLERQAIDFVNDSTKNKLEDGRLQLSSIFKWYRKDFTGKMDLVDLIRKYAKDEVAADTKITYMDYDWSLNGE